MSNGHLVFDGFHLVMSSLFTFAVTKAGEITFDFSAQLKSLLIEQRFSGNTCSCVIGNIEIFGATVTVETVVFNRTAEKIVFSEFFAGF
jgi:hypothetical protein